MNKTTRIDIPSSSSPSLASADGELHEDDIFAIDITHAPPSGILAALPEPSGNSYLNHVFHHKPASVLSTSVSSTASSSSSSGGGGGGGARTIPAAAPKPPQERLPFTSSFINGGKFPQSAPVQVPSAMMNRAGRTLKGRDLRQVRNAVFRRTGFID
ncbi:hypothetical protein Rs2_26426 [Raphanus sativus]|nr:hypothetical protein Rs2_26426 [Raphanus sativus]